MPTCLIVDDSSVVRKVARRILEDLDFTVEVAEDGEEAFEKCKANMPDTILLDWNLPMMSGLDFLKLLRAFIGGEKPHIVYCTVEHDIGIIAMARKEGADDYMMKPFDRKSLEAKFNLSRFAAA